MSKRFLLVFSTAMLLFGECVHVPETRKSRLQVFATDITGAPISDLEIELTPAGGTGNAITTNGKETQVLYGDYHLRVHAKGFDYARRELRIHQPELHVRVELRLGSVGCPLSPAEIGGRIKRGNAATALWVKAIPVRGIGGSETRVTDGGYFVMSGLEHNAYIVAVVEGERILHQQIVKASRSGDAKLDIDLSQNK